MGKTTEFDRLESLGFKPKFKKGDIVETKSHIKYYRKWTILEVGYIQYIVDNDIRGTILFKYEDDWQLAN